jgi:S-DNA-T family DNA segregation ATPase FtsK/SpoIIIE
VYANGFPAHKSFPFSSEEYTRIAGQYQIPIVVGKNVNEELIIFDMLKDPHLLVMGETGSGKSVYLRSLLTFLITFMGNRVELVLGDLKRTEFFIFRNVGCVQSVSISPEALLIQLCRVNDELEKRGD